MATFLLAAAAAFLFVAAALTSLIAGSQMSALGFVGLAVLSLAIATLRPMPGRP